ncbi:unnamed protein product [Ceutorhynchus assimilis]|uniref:Pre-rRNA-processing protein Ipi1 N-terminal domain-containing protein n=1 Tax=Ceutorhynchus assimilis TaxID=467358 RepID=A0A9N9MUD8_9CUCU|nr:unnamed protein product [Ceutorhynchus assimilis]
MGKNHRHKKDLKAEKAKTKLKQSKTKFLPKGQNVTNTAFKIKPIVLQEQLKQRYADDILSKRKLNVKDLLTRVKHYNENVRHTACEELTDMVKYYTQEIVQQYLSQVCLAIGNLMQDKEMKVRKAGVKCTDTILSFVPNEKLTPFIDIFSTNLRCAMTNIDKNIQEDSLSFLDCFINKDCGLISKSSEKLLPDFLSLISKLRNDSQLGRTLTLNLGSKMTSVTWRIKVLSRLHAVLSVILGKHHTEGHIEESEDNNNVFSANKTSICPIYKEALNKKIDGPIMDIFSINNTLNYNNSDTINKHILTLIPLLYETWLEVTPEQKVQKSASESSVLSEEIAALLTCITNTLYLLWQYVKRIENDEVNLKTVFMSSDGQKFLKHLLTGFPYCHPGSRKKFKNPSLKILESNTDARCVHENLMICFLYLVLYVNCTQHNLMKDSGPISAYLTKIFIQKNALGENCMQCILELLKECFGSNYQKWLKSGVDLDMILVNSIHLYAYGRISEKNKLKLFQILTNIVSNEHMSRNSNYQNWLSTLPNILCETSIPDTTILALLELSKRNCSTFHKALAQKIPDVIENLEKIQIVLTTDSILHNETAAKRNLASIFYYLPASFSGNMQLFEEFITRTRSEFRKHIEDVLVLRKEFRRS